jgi:hypothetical protein
MFRGILFLLVGVCAQAGTAVGHPVPTKVSTGTGLVYTAGTLPVSTTVFDHCNNTFETVTVNDELDLLAQDPLVIPPGYTCGIRINLSDRFELAGTGPSSSSFELSLGVGYIDIDVDPPIFVDSEGDSDASWIRLAAPNWVTATLLGLDPSEHVVVGATHSLHDQLRDDVRYDSMAW